MKFRNLIYAKSSVRFFDSASMDEGKDAAPESATTDPTPLSSIVGAFEDLAEIVRSTSSDDDNSSDQAHQELRLSVFCEACSHVSILFNCLGIAFKFAESEYINKVGSLSEASKTYETLEDVLDVDVENSTVKCQGSLSRNLRRVRQGLDLIRALFVQFMSTNGYSLKDAASTAYSQVCAPYHSWAVRTAVAAGMYALPTRDQLLVKLNESGESAEEKMNRYIVASQPVIEYIDKLYISRNITLDW